MAAFLNQLALSFDLPILDWIQANLQSPLMDKIMPIITLFGEGGVFWIAWAVLMLILPKTRKIGISMLFALILGLLVCNITLKPLVARIRPYDLQAQLGVTINLLIKEQSDFSFPSGHTGISFAAVGALFAAKSRLGVPAFVLALIIAFSRLYLYVHWPSDVLGGAVLGAAVGWAGAWLVQRAEQALARRRA